MLSSRNVNLCSSIHKWANDKLRPSLLKYVFHSSLFSEMWYNLARKTIQLATHTCILEHLMKWRAPTGSVMTSSRTETTWTLEARNFLRQEIYPCAPVVETRHHTYIFLLFYCYYFYSWLFARSHMYALLRWLLEHYDNQIKTT